MHTLYYILSYLSYPIRVTYRAPTCCAISRLAASVSSSCASETSCRSAWRPLARLGKSSAAFLLPSKRRKASQSSRGPARPESARVQADVDQCSMAFHGFPWLSIDFCWIFDGFHGLLMVFDGFSWDFHGSLKALGPISRQLRRPSRAPLPGCSSPSRGPGPPHAAATAGPSPP